MIGTDATLIGLGYTKFYSMNISASSSASGAPAFKVSYSDQFTIWGKRDGVCRDFTFAWRGGSCKMECTKKDDKFGSTTYLNTTVHRFLPGAKEAYETSDEMKLEKVASKSFGSGGISYSANLTKILGLIKRAKGYSFPLASYIKTYYYRKTVGFESHQNARYGDFNPNSYVLPGFVLFNGIIVGNSWREAAYSLVINNRWMYKITYNKNGYPYTGAPSTMYGNKSFKFSVPFTCNCPGQLYVVFTGVYGSANGDSFTISQSIGGVTSTGVVVSGSHNFKKGAYKVSIRFVESGSITWGDYSPANIYADNPGFSYNKNIIVFYGPGDPYSPPNTNPVYSVSNITPEGQFGTNQTKTIGARITLSDNGVSQYWLSSMTYTLSAYWNDGTKIGSWTVHDSNMNNCSSHTTDFSTTVNVRPGMRHKDDYVYWTVSGTSKDTTGKTRSGGTKSSGKTNLFWAYVEPNKIAFNSSRITASSGPKFSSSRAQLYYGGTNLTFVLQATINAWGDRPGVRTYEFSLNHGGGVAKWYGRIKTSDTNTKTHTYSYVIPDNWVNSSADFTVYKRLDNTEYLFSGNYKNPTLGTNHSSGGTISFYEVIGGVSGMIDVKPSILMVTIPFQVTGQGIYDKQSSQKVRYYVEVFDRDTSKVIGQYVLGNTTGDITKNVTIDLSSSSFTIPEAHLYELRLKADVTELLGNVHTYTFYTTTRQAFLPPRYTLTEKTNMLLPPNSYSSLLIRQKATNTYTYRINYDLTLSASTMYIEYYLASSPNVKRTKTVNILPKNYTGGGFNGSYTFPNPSTLDPSDPMYDPEGFALGTKVVVYIKSSWTLPGSTSIYSNQSGSVYYDVTPTRYIFFLTRNVENEQWMNKVHSVTLTRADKVSKKIFVETDII